MSYRNLVVGDYVKIKKKGHEHFGNFGIVDCVDTEYDRVIVHVYAHTHPGAAIIDVDQFWMSELIVAKKFDVSERPLYKHVSVDNDDECEYDGWDRDDLIEKIKELERVIAEHEEPF